MYVTLKLEIFTISVRNTGCKRKKKTKINISVCSLKCEVKVKVTKVHSQGQGHKIICWSGRTHQYLQTYQVRHTCDKWCEREQAKVNISVCPLKREVKVKVTKLCVGREEIISAYEPTE